LCLASVSTAAPIPLASHDQEWNYRRGDSEPQAGWQILEEAMLDFSWALGTGGFGYADNHAETEDCLTLLPDMEGGYTTFCLRRDFILTTIPAPDEHLFLRVDYDDGFVAWLDGIHVAGRNSPAGSGEPDHADTASANHESSRGNSTPQPVEVIDLGPGTNWLGTGPHTLALMALNSSLDSSDCILVTDLYLERREPAGSNAVNGTIAVDTTWAAADSPVTVVGHVTVNPGVTLTIEPGVTVRFNEGLGMTVNGCLLAEGNAALPITFTRAPGASSWNRIVIEGGENESRITHATIAYATGRGNLTAIDTVVALAHVVFTNTTVQLVAVDNTAIDFRHCVFPSTLNDELIHFHVMPPDGHARIISNWFGNTSGYNDIIDFTGGNRPGPIPLFLGNVFTAGVDDCFDLDGTDAHIEGNIFLNVRQEAIRESTSNPIATGADGGNTSELFICRNIFFNCDHALLLKDRGSVVLQNNTIVRLRDNPLDPAAASVINFYEARSGVTPGATAFVEGNIMWDVDGDRFALNFTNGFSNVHFNHNLFATLDLPFPVGADNLTNDPLFVGYAIDLDPAAVTPDNVRSVLALKAESPARGRGPNGLDMGALVPGGASISGGPGDLATNHQAVLTVAGPGVVAYRWRLNQGPWSVEIPLTNTVAITTNLFGGGQPITLNGLSPGTYHVEVLGKNSAGYWQEEPGVSRTWTVPVEIAVMGGEISADSSWSPALGEVRVVSDLVLAPGIQLRIEPGTSVRFDPGVSLRSTNAVLRILGTASAPVRLGPWETGGTWGPITVQGAKGELEVVHADLEAGSIDIRDGAMARLEDSTIHGLPAVPIVRALRPGQFVMRRCRVYDYYEILSQLALSTIEDCYFHDISGDGIDFDGALPGSVIRGCTLAGGMVPNVDAIDIGNYPDGTVSANVVIEGCRLRDFPFDKGVSIGEQARGIIVRDCVIHDIDSGVAVKDSAEAELYHNTIAASAHGLNLYEKVGGQGGGHAVAWNNVFWGNADAVTMDPLSSLGLTFSNVAGGFPGEGNLDIDPLFRDPAVDDYRLTDDSPVRGQGRGGADMGARLPVGSSLVDSDADGLPDPWEELHGLGPADGTDALADADADGLDNRAEYVSGTDPRNPGSRLRLEIVRDPAEGASLEFDGVAGRSYRIDFMTLADAAWGTWTNLPPIATDSRVSLFEPETTREARFYRLSVDWPP
jgi:hypothetical protein